ncbi:hypothetical protein JCM10213_004550 [Rhodosporidiobolus nylandii]
MVKKKASTQLQPAPAAPAPKPAPSSLFSPSSPLPFGHYLPRLPLQLIALLFSIFAASSHVDDRIIGISRVVTALSTDPLAVLPVACGLAALVQTWFGYWVRSCRNEAKKAAEKAAKGGDAVEDEQVPQKKGRGFKASFGDMWDRAMKGEAPHQTMWKRAQQKKKPGQGLGGIDTRFVPQAVMVTLGATLVFHAAAVLLGAPLFSHFTETFLTSLLLSILSITPLSIAIPPFNSTNERYVWLRLFSNFSPLDDLEFAVFAPALGAIIGCWLGAVPIPLDWDRPWQKWPTTCVLGALFGYAAGAVVSLAVTGYRAMLAVSADVVREAKELEEQQKQKEKQVAVKGKKGGKAQ